MSDLNRVLEGRVWKFGDSVDTNQLAGGGLVGHDAEETLRINCLRALRPEFAEQARSGDILVAGRNFGCGSSRQTAVQALQLCGVVAVLAESIARIHLRNSIALALPTFVVPGVGALVEDGDHVKVDYRQRRVVNVSRGKELVIGDLPAMVLRIYEAGGLTELIVRRLAAMGIGGTRACQP